MNPITKIIAEQKEELERHKEHCKKYPMLNQDGTKNEDWNYGYKNGLNRGQSHITSLTLALLEGIIKETNELHDAYNDDVDEWSGERGAKCEGHNEALARLRTLIQQAIDEIK